MQHPCLQQLVLAAPRLYGKSVMVLNCTHTRYYILQLYCSCMCKYYFRIRKSTFELQLKKLGNYRFNGNATKIWIYELCTSPKHNMSYCQFTQTGEARIYSSTNTKYWEAIRARTMYGLIIRSARLHRHALPIEPCSALASIHRKVQLGWIASEDILTGQGTRRVQMLWVNAH